MGEGGVVPLGYLSPNHMYGTLLPILFTVFMTTSPQHMQAWSPPLPTAGLRMGEQGAKQRGNKRNLQEEEKAALEKKVRKRKGGISSVQRPGRYGLTLRRHSHSHSHSRSPCFVYWCYPLISHRWDTRSSSRVCVTIRAGSHITLSHSLCYGIWSPASHMPYLCIPVSNVFSMA